MSAPGHCHHCEEDCSGGKPIPAWVHLSLHTNELGAMWHGGGCPACDEAERIAAALDSRNESYIDTDGYRSIRVYSPQEYAAILRRGEL